MTRDLKQTIAALMRHRMRNTVVCGYLRTDPLEGLPWHPRAVKTLYPTEMIDRHVTPYPELPCRT